MVNISKRTIIVILVIIVVGGIVGLRLLSKNRALPYEFIIAQKGDLIREVSVTGRVKAAESVDLAFEKSGRVSAIYVKVGDKVQAGQTLISLENADLMAQLAQASASVESAKAQLNQYTAALESQQAKLNELKGGTRPEDIKVKEAELKKAQQDLDNYYGGISDILNDSYTNADDAVNKQIDELFSNDASLNPQLTFSITDSQTKIDVESKRITAGQELSKLKSEINNLPADHLSLDKSLTDAKNHLTIIRDFLARLNDAVNSAVGLTQTTIATYKGYTNTARTNVNTAISDITTQQDYILAQKITVEKIQNELALKQAGTATEQITAQEAQVKQAEATVSSQEAQLKYAEANVRNIQAQIAKTILKAPINGLVTKQEAKVGEIVSLNVSVVSIISEAKFEIETNVPEADIAKVKLGDSAKVTLDAYGEEVIFEAKVITIDPAETLIEGVATYKTTLQFIQEDERPKPGMTANVDILTDRKENVIAIPQRAVIVADGEKMVKIVDNQGLIKEVKVETGLRGSDGNIEILSGINEGDKIIVSIKK